MCISSIDERLELTRSCIARRVRQRRARRELLEAKYTGMRYKVCIRARECGAACRARISNRSALVTAFELRMGKGVPSWKRSPST